MKKLLATFALILSLAVLAACGGDETTGSTGGTGGTGSAPSGTVTVDSGSGAENTFVPATLEAAAGEVKVTFNNKGAVQHNWTLVKQGDEDKAVNEATANAPAFVPTTTFIAHTKTLNGGENETITFSAEPGTYSFICTFPGHYALGMKGTLTVK